MDAVSQDQSQNSMNSDLPGESDSGHLGRNETFHTTPQVSQNIPVVVANKIQSFASQHDESGLLTGEEQTQTSQDVSNKWDMEKQKIGPEDYTCPLGESDLESDEVMDSEKADNDNGLQIPKSCFLSPEIRRDLETRVLKVCLPLLNIADLPYSLSAENSKMSSTFASQPDNKGLGSVKEDTQASGNALNECGMEGEETGTEDMWKLRSNRVEQIFSPFNKDFGPFNKSRKACLEFNVGFGPKQNKSVDTLTRFVLLEIAEFALALTSSQQDFIMEILEYNFDLNLQSEHHRQAFARELMKKVKQLTRCPDAVKFSNNVFKLCMFGGEIPALSRNLKMEECDVPSYPHDSHPYPWCKKIGLKLHVVNGKQSKKLNINKLTHGAMTEVADFAEKLCGTFEQIFLDIVRHNFDVDVQSGDSDLARNILAGIPAAVEKRNLVSCRKNLKRKTFSLGNITSTLKIVESQDRTESDPCGYGRPSTTVTEQNTVSCHGNEQQKEIDLYLWKLRASQIEQILSIPHEEQCPLYSYSRCKRLGIDFNIGSGVKQNLDLKFLTNGIMVELHTFATVLESAQRHFLTEILEHNFDLDLKTELHRTSFIRQTWTKINNLCRSCKRSALDMPFKLPPIKELAFDKATYCPKCYQVREHYLCQDESNSGPVLNHGPHSMTDAVSANKNCAAENSADAPSSILTEETIMASYHRCREVGLNLCVDKDRPKDKLDTHVLTGGIVMEVVHFAHRLCGTKSDIIHALIKHNFDIGEHILGTGLLTSFGDSNVLEDEGSAWFDKAFVIHQVSHTQHRTVPRVKRKSDVQGGDCEWKEVIKKRKVALQTKEKEDTLPSHNTSVVKRKTFLNMAQCFPLCTELGLDLDVKSKSGKKEKMSLNLLTTAVVVEIHKYAVSQPRQYLPGDLFDILDYNFDLSSQHHRRWDFSLATAFKIQAIVKQYRKRAIKPDKVFRLPFVLAPKKRGLTQKCNLSSQEDPNDTCDEGGAVHQVKYHSNVSNVSFLSGVVNNDEPTAFDEDTQTPIAPLMMSVQEKGSQVDTGCESPLQRNIHIKEEFTPYHGDVKPEPNTEETYYCHYKDVKIESNQVDAENSVLVKPQENLGNANHQDYSTSYEIPRKLESNCWDTSAPFSTTTDGSAALPTASTNVNPLVVHLTNEWGPCAHEKQTETIRNVRNGSGMEQKELGQGKDDVCPQEEIDKNSDVIDLGGAGHGTHLQIPTCSDTPLESEPSCSGNFAPSLSSTDIFCSLPSTNFSVDPSLASQPNEKYICGGEEEIQTTTNVINKHDTEAEEMGTENMWKLRANQVEQILLSQNRHFGTFIKSKKVGLEFNVGSGPKQNISVDSLNNEVLLEIAKFTLAMNSSQQDFILEILEYNFDLGLQSRHDREIFACEVMNRVRRLTCCEDAVKFSNEVFELPSSIASINVINQSMDRVLPDPSCKLKEETCDVPVCPPDPHAKSKDLMQNSVGYNHWCKDIGLKLHVNSCQPNKKLEINKLTNAAMTEVADFAEKLCGTFEQIFQDILQHNFDVNLQSGESDMVKNILGRIPAATAQKNLSFCYVLCLKRQEPQDCRNWPNSDLHGSASSSVTITEGTEDISVDKQQNELNLKLWNLRASQIKQILSIPHEEHCPLYSYSRCKKLGINFNVASGEKQNLDPKLLTNGVLVELNTFASALVSAKEDFITDILENNFSLNLKNEACHSNFTEQIKMKMKSKMEKVQKTSAKSKVPFELPALTCTQVPVAYCPKCYQWRSQRHHQDESDTGCANHSRPNTMTDTISADENYTDQKPAKGTTSNLFETEKRIMDSYPLCKEIGLNLFADQKKDKLDMHVFTFGVMREVASFASKLSGKKCKIVNELVEHNFNVGKHVPSLHMTGGMNKSNVNPNWFDEVVVFQRNNCNYPGHSEKHKQYSSMQEKKETVKKRRLALETKERASLQSDSTNVGESKSNHQTTGAQYPICAKIGLDLDTTFRKRKKKKLNLNLLTFAVVMEIHEFATQQRGLYYSRTVFEILDFNFNLSSQHYRRWEFSLATASKIQAAARQYLEKPGRADEVFTLPFVFEPSDISTCLATINSNDNTIQSDSGEISEDESDSEKEEMNYSDTCSLEESVTHLNMWKLRSKRVDQILCTLNCVFGPFTNSKRHSLEFNVGFRPKKNISMDSLHDTLLHEIAKFALAINSSQKEFIVEILEYNFDLGLQSQHDRNTFACDVIKRVRQLRRCEDAVRFSRNVFELPGPRTSLHGVQKHVDSVIPKSKISRTEKCNVVPSHPHDSHPYPWCKKIGLKLHVDSCKQSKKLKINKLTNGAMTEVADFAEKLCGTFEEIFLDIIRHNFDVDWQSGDSDLARNILARVPAVVDQMNREACANAFELIKIRRRSISTVEKLDCQNNPNLDAHSADSSQAAIADPKEGSTAYTEQKNELSLKLWKLRSNQVKQILSIPHEEHCPLYSYSRCKKLGIDFNVGSGVKQNLDLNLLTNGVMVELNTFATAVSTAKRHFVTDILEYNFDLNFDSELCRAAFTKLTRQKYLSIKHHTKHSLLNLPFELPDMTCIQYSTAYCPRCHEARECSQDESNAQPIYDPNPHYTMHSLSAAANCQAQKPKEGPSSTLSTSEKTMMDSYPRCKKIGLNLLVDKDQPNNKLDTHVLTRGIMLEVRSFARTLCGSKSNIINDVLEHNFNMEKQSLNVHLSEMSSKMQPPNDDRLTHFNEVSTLHPTVQRSEWNETIKKRKLPLQTKEKGDKVLSHCDESARNHYPVCRTIRLNLEVNSKQRLEENLDLKLLTTSAVLEIHRFASKKSGRYYSRIVFDILDYNFDLSSQYYRRWEFATVTASKIQTFAKQCCGKPGSTDEIFTLPFVFDPEASEKFAKNRPSEKRAKSLHESDMEQKELIPESYDTCCLKDTDLESDEMRGSENKGNQSLSGETQSCLGVSTPFVNSNDIPSNFPAINSKMVPAVGSQHDKKELRGPAEQTQTSGNKANESDMEQEEMGTEMMWKSRSNRVEQIFSALSGFGSFHRSRRVGLEFNVGFGPKQNISIDSWGHSVLLEIAKFVLAMNSSQQDFIMEILEHNFDLGLQSQQHRNTFAFEVMTRVRQLTSCENAVKLSNEVFKLPDLMASVNMTNESLRSDIPEPSSLSGNDNAETKEHLSHRSVCHYPRCKDIGLKLCVNSSQPGQKMAINKLTNGAMVEVADFAERLCGTFDQVCLDILRHNIDADLQGEHSDLARSLLAQIRTAMEQQNLAAHVKRYRTKSTRKEISTAEKLDCQNMPNLASCSVDSSSAAVTDQNVNSSADSDQEKKLNLKLWKMRANQIQQILSIPHEEQCPLYSYSRCKKLGVDFNVGSGEKQNLDPKLLTSDIMVELTTFATEMASAAKHFVTEILEYNFDLTLKDELYRNAFAQQTLGRMTFFAVTTCKSSRQRLPFKLPDITNIQPSFAKTVYCPKCYEDRHSKLLQDASEPGHRDTPHPHSVTDSVSSHAICIAKDPSSPVSKVEEELMDTYPHCKKAGVNLCIDKDQPKDKLDMHVLTCRIMKELSFFAKRLCGTKSKLIRDLVEHNFNMGEQKVDLVQRPCEAKSLNDGRLSWFDKVFDIHPPPHRQLQDVSKLREAAAMHGSEKKEVIRNRKQALQMKAEAASRLSHTGSVVQLDQTCQSTEKCFPICTAIGLDLDVKSKSGEKEKLDLELLTTGAVVEIHKFVAKQAGGYSPYEMLDILDYNFDLSSQYDRRWEFSIAMVSKVEAEVRRYRKKRGRADRIFKLPFVVPPKTSRRSAQKKPKGQSTKHSQEKSDQTPTVNSSVYQREYPLHTPSQIKEEQLSCDEDKHDPTNLWTTNKQITQRQEGIGWGTPLQGNLQWKEENDPQYGFVKTELDTEETNKTTCNEVKMESASGSVWPSGTSGPAASLGFMSSMCQNSESNIKPENENKCVQYYIMAEPQVSDGHIMLAVCPDTGSAIETQLDVAGVEYLFPVEVAGAQGYTMNLGQSNESTPRQEEDDNISCDLNQYEVVVYTESDMKQD